jgi:citrate synthase
LIIVNTVSLIDAEAAARRMGVKVSTIYAYVSRGMLTRHVGTDGRRSWFDTRDVEALAVRGRPRQASQRGAMSLVIETALTSIESNGVRFRGRAAAELATTRTFEEVAELLWRGEGALDDAHVWPVLNARRVDARSTDRSPKRPAGDGRSLLGCIRAEVGRHADSGEHQDGPLDADEVAMSGRRLIADVVQALPYLGDGRAARLVLTDRSPIRSTTAGALWPRLTTRRATPSRIALVNAVLVLMADHEIAASTLAVRVAASTHANPAAAVCAGLGAFSGPLHGGASAGVRLLLLRASDVGPAMAVSEFLAAGKRLPGFGHRVYPGVDPRAAVLFDLLRASDLPQRDVRIAEDVWRIAADRIGRQPNVDFALATLALAADMTGDASEALMCIARLAGWLAHVIEEYDERPLRFRPRAAYVGVRAGHRTT